MRYRIHFDRLMSAFRLLMSDKITTLDLNTVRLDIRLFVDDFSALYGESSVNLDTTSDSLK